MTAPGRTPAEYKGVAQFLSFLAHAGERDAAWHQHTGYVPVTLAGLRAVASSRASTTKNPGADLPI